MIGQYVLDGHEPVLEPDLTTWGRWMGKADRHVARETVADGVEVSTVFLGLDHGWGEGPMLFESMVFGGPLDGEMDRYSTWDEAEAGHKAMVARASSMVAPSPKSETP